MSFDNRFEQCNPWLKMLKDSNKDFLENPQEFSKNMIDGIMNFYKETMKHNPYVARAVDAINSNKEAFENVSFKHNLDVMRDINHVVSEMFQSIMGLQHEYLCEIFAELGKMLKDKEMMNLPDNCKDYSKKFTEKSTAHFANVSEIIFKSNQEISDLLNEFCTTCQKDACEKYEEK